MKIVYRQEFIPKVYLEGWNHVTATENEYAFMQACEKQMMWWDFDDGVQLTYPTDIVRRVKLWRSLLEYANKYGIEVDEAFLCIYEKAEKELQTKEGQEELLAYVNLKRSAWKNRQEMGCMFCKDCEQIGKGWFRCKYSGDDLATRVSEYWDQVTNTVEMFHEVGVPNEHCRDYYNERIKEVNHGQI